MQSLFWVDMAIQDIKIPEKCSVTVEKISNSNDKTLFSKFEKQHMDQYLKLFGASDV